MSEQNKVEPTNPGASEESAPTQEHLYDDLRRIGQLEDQKREIQREIDDRTQRLAAAVPTLAPESLLYQLLSRAMPAAKPVKKKPAAKRPVKKKKTT